MLADTDDISVLSVLSVVGKESIERVYISILSCFFYFAIYSSNGPLAENKRQKKMLSNHLFSHRTLSSPF